MNDDNLNRLFSEYLPKVIRLAEYNIAPGQNIEAEDVAQTVFRTAFRRMSEGKFKFDDEVSLWKQLVAITLNRLANKVRDAKALKRGGGEKTVPIEVFMGVSREPDPTHVAELADVVMMVRNHLDDDGRKVLEMRLSGYDYAEIAEQFINPETGRPISVKSVQRKMNIIKEKLSELFPDISLPD